MGRGANDGTDAALPVVVREVPALKVAIPERRLDGDVVPAAPDDGVVVEADGISIRPHPGQGSGGEGIGDELAGETKIGGGTGCGGGCAVGGERHKFDGQQPSEVAVQHPIPVADVGGNNAQARGAGIVGSASYYGLICSYSWPCGEAISVWLCESSGNWLAYSGGNFGGYQINQVHAARVGGVPGRLFDPATNVAVAYVLWQEQGWGPWACAPK